MGALALDRWEKMDVHNKGLRLSEPNASHTHRVCFRYVASPLYGIVRPMEVLCGSITSSSILGN